MRIRGSRSQDRSSANRLLTILGLVWLLGVSMVPMVNARQVELELAMPAAMYYPGTPCWLDLTVDPDGQVVASEGRAIPLAASIRPDPRVEKEVQTLKAGIERLPQEVRLARHMEP